MNLEVNMRSPVTARPDEVESLPSSRSADALDELHTVSALLVATLAIAESGGQVERCLSVATVELQKAVRKLSSAA